MTLIPDPIEHTPDRVILASNDATEVFGYIPGAQPEFPPLAMRVRQLLDPRCMLMIKFARIFARVGITEPDAIARRAGATVDALFAEGQKRNWVFDIPREALIALEKADVPRAGFDIGALATPRKASNIEGSY